MRAALMAAVVAVTLAATACATAPPRDPVAPPLRFAAPTEPLAAIATVAHESGLFSAHGANVDFVAVDCGIRALDDLLAREYELALASDVALARRTLDTQDFRIVATIAVAEDDSRVVARRSAGIEVAAHLAGKRIGVVRDGQPHCYLHTLLESESLAEDDVELVFLEADEGAQALLDGTIDAYATRPPTIDRLANELGDDAVVLAAPVNPSKMLSLVVHPDVLEHRADELVSVLAALIDAEGDVAPLTGADFTVHLGQDLLVALEEHARWIIGSPCFSKVAETTPIPDTLAVVDPEPLASLDPNRVRLLGWSAR